MYYKYGSKDLTQLNDHALKVAIETELQERLKNVVQTIAEETVEDYVYSYPETDSYDRTGELKDAVKTEEEDYNSVVCYIDGDEFVEHADNPSAHRQYFESDSIDYFLHYLHHGGEFYNLMDIISANIDTRFKKEFVYGGSKYD